jgi:hypothetical protein
MRLPLISATVIAYSLLAATLICDTGLMSLY